MTPARDVVSTIGPGAGQEWERHVEWFPPPRSAAALPWWLIRFGRLSRGRRAVVLRGTSGFGEGYRDLLAAAVLSRWHRDLRVVISDATIEPGSRSLERRLPTVGGRVGTTLSRLLVRLADGPGVVWCVLSRAELESFPATWGVDPRKVVFTPFTSTTWRRPTAPASASEPTGAGYVFSGGDSLRDYDLLLSAVRPLGVRTVVATSWRPEREEETVDVGLVPHEEFMALMAAARVVVLPLEVTTRSTGQQTYLNAMWFERPVIVTDAPGVHDHVEDGVTGVVVPAEAGALRAAVADVFDDSRREHYAQMGRRARAAVEDRYRDEHYRRRLLEVAGVL